MYSLLRRRFRAQNVLLLVGSYVFCGWSDVHFLFLIVPSTAIDCVAGLLIDRGAPDTGHLRGLLP